MKKVIHTPVVHELISLEDVLKNKSPIVGFVYGKEQKATLIPVKYQSDLYFARCVNDWQDGNCFSPNGEHSKTVAQWEEFFRKSHKAEMFVFDSPKELFQWLAE